MSGTLAYKQRIEAEHQGNIDQMVAVSNNRAGLLSAVASYMHTEYGDTSFYNDHPLVIAIQNSANGVVIDLDQLAVDVANYQLPEVQE
jgi:hypothetical protein